MSWAVAMTAHYSGRVLDRPLQDSSTSPTSNVTVKTVVNPFINGMTNALEPDEDLLISEWADTYRKLPRESSMEYGQFRTSRTPYLKEIMDCLSPQSPVKEVVFIKCTQIGATDGIGNNFLLYTAHKKPRPCLMILPTVELAGRHSKSKVDKTLSVMPCMSGLIRDSKGGKKRDESVLMKEFPGGFWMFLGSNSASAARSVSICNLILDDVDGFKMEISDEGDPIDIIKKRTDSFSAIAKILSMSTPTSETSRIWAMYLTTDQCYYHVPCPHCGHMQRLLWGGPGMDFGMKWTNNDPETARYLCAHCHEYIPETHKTYMLTNGLWVPTNPKITQTRGFQLSSLYSPYGWVSWPQMVKEFIDGYKEPRKLKVFKNTRLGEIFEEKGEQPEWILLKNRSEPYPLWTAPEGVGLISAGVDVQPNRLAVTIKGWGRGEESWLIWWGEIFGDTKDETSDIWSQLKSVLTKPIRHAYGFDMRVLCCAVDSSDNTHIVYNFIRKNTGRYIAIKGSSTANKPILGRPSKQDVNYKGAVIKNGVDLWMIGTDTAKESIYTNLTQEHVGPGYMHFPIGMTDDYYRQLTSEKHVTKYDKSGFACKEWVLPHGRRNEALDCEVYATAAAIKLGLLHINWDKLMHNQKNKRTTSILDKHTQESMPATVYTDKPPASTIRHRGRSNYMRR